MYIHAEEVSDVTYVIDRARVKVKAIGALTRWDIQSLHKTEPVAHVNRVAADSGDIDECTVDLSKVGVNVCTLTLSSWATYIYMYILTNRTLKLLLLALQILKEQQAKDNPFWPNSSAEDKARDEAAGLAPPKVTDNGEWELSEQDIECLAIGAGILGCGGGGDPHGGRLRALQQLDAKKKIKILNPCRYVI